MLDVLWTDQDQGLSLDEITATASDLNLLISATAPTACCPLCQLPSDRIHSHYHRSLADVPLACHTVHIRLRVRRFFCDQLGCPRRIFVERLAELVSPYAHRTRRMSTALRQIGLALGGEAGQRLAADLQLPTSPDTILRFVRRMPDQPPTCSPRVLGVDDFCFRKGRTYGTILVDLETHRVVDLLPDREAGTLATWLLQHPGAEIISRDRAGAFAEGARLGAPHALQVADKFHLLCNLGDALEELLVRLYPELKAAIKRSEESTAQPAAVHTVACSPDRCHSDAVDGTISPSGMESKVAEDQSEAAALAEPEQRPRRRAVELCAARRSARQMLYDEVQQLNVQGWSKAAIARKTGLSRDTVAKWLQSPVLPERQERPRRASQLDAYKSLLRERWEQGVRNAKLLWRELREKGYWGGYNVVAEYVARLRQEHGIPLRRGAYADRYQPKRADLARPRELRWLLWKPATELSEDENKTVAALCQSSKELESAYELAAEFRTMVRERGGAKLPEWITKAQASGVAEIVSFARGVVRDFAAVTAGLSLEWSQGAVEGHVNRLKMLKRQCYGRAKLDLLRLRVLHAS